MLVYADQEMWRLQISAAIALHGETNSEVSKLIANNET